MESQNNMVNHHRDCRYSWHCKICYGTPAQEYTRRPHLRSKLRATMAGYYKIPVPRMTDNITVWGNYIYLSAGMKRYYVYDTKMPFMGRGGMGEVYRGYDCLTGEPVAIKRLYDRYCSIPSIRRKARIESGLVFSHPNIIEMLGYCEYRSGKGLFSSYRAMFKD